MTDLSKTIAPKSDQLNADDLIGGPRTITVTRVSANPDSAEQPVSVYFEGDGGKPFKPCKSMRRVMVAVWGADGHSYTGRRMTLYRDPKVTFGGMEVGGIRISHMSDIDRPQTMALTATRAKRAPFTVQPLPAAPNAAHIQALAREVAGRGVDEFRAFYSSPEGKAGREAIREIMAECRSIAEAADAAKQAPEGPEADDPFGLPEIPKDEDDQ